MTGGRSGPGAFAIFNGTVDMGSGIGEPAGRRASSNVPHIPQKWKLFELSSPHFGQITLVLRYVLSYSLTRASDAIRFVCSY
jgi:hypothetical protein